MLEKTETYEESKQGAAEEFQKEPEPNVSMVSKLD